MFEDPRKSVSRWEMGGLNRKLLLDKTQNIQILVTPVTMPTKLSYYLAQIQL